MANHPSSSKARAVASGFFRYPENTVGPLTRISPTVSPSRGTSSRECPLFVTLTEIILNGRPLVQIASNCSSSVLRRRNSSDKMLMEIFPQHSVMPYETKNSHPNRAIARLTIVGGNGDPPHERSRTLERSHTSPYGLCERMVTIVDARLLTVTRSSAMTRRSLDASNDRRKTCRPATSVME